MRESNLLEDITKEFGLETLAVRNCVTPFTLIPKVAFPHSPTFTVSGRDTKANSLAYMGIRCFPSHILTIERVQVNVKIRTINFSQ